MRDEMVTEPIDWWSILLVILTIVLIRVIPVIRQWFKNKGE